MTNEEYQDCQFMVLNTAKIINTLPLKDFIETINRCETIAPILDPTLYMKGHENLSKIKEIAQIMRRVQQVSETIKE